MDGEFVEGLLPGKEYLDPLFHRLLGGHTPTDAWRAVREALPDDTLAQEFVGCLRALGSDLATHVGLPLTTLTATQVEAVRAFLGETLGLSRDRIADILSCNAVEATAAAVPMIAIAMGWTIRDAERFARLAGSLAVSAFVAGNPLMALLALVLLAKSFHGVRHERGLVGELLGGGVQAGVVLVTGSLIGGPALLGAITGIGVAVGIQAAARSRKVLGADVVGRLSDAALEQGLRVLSGWRERRDAMA